MQAVAIRIAGDKQMSEALGESLLAKELERTRAELTRVKADRDLLAWGIRQSNNRKLQALEERMATQRRRRERLRRLIGLFIQREE